MLDARGGVASWLEQLVDSARARGEHLDREHGCRQEGQVCDVAVLRDQDVGLQHGVVGEDDVERCDEHAEVGRSRVLEQPP